MSLAEKDYRAAANEGWHVTNGGEAGVALALRKLGYGPRDVETQFNLGPYKLDFAIVRQRIDIEADGWVHTTRDVRKRSPAARRVTFSPDRPRNSMGCPSAVRLLALITAPPRPSPRRPRNPCP